jgi:hypothetical protein
MEWMDGREKDWMLDVGVGWVDGKAKAARDEADQQPSPASPECSEEKWKRGMEKGPIDEAWQGSGKEMGGGGQSRRGSAAGAGSARRQQTAADRLTDWMVDAESLKGWGLVGWLAGEKELTFEKRRGCQFGEKNGRVEERKDGRHYIALYANLVGEKSVTDWMEDFCNKKQNIFWDYSKVKEMRILSLMSGNQNVTEGQKVISSNVFWVKRRKRKKKQKAADEKEGREQSWSRLLRLQLFV